MSARLTRIAVFYDGNFFFKVSNYYRHAHPRKARIAIPGLHDLIRQQVAQAEAAKPELCKIVETHFFRGRFSAKAAEERQQLYNDRVFDDILMGEGVDTHYLPMRNGSEKGVDVALALEVYERTLLKHFDVVVLITGDGDFVPLVKKLGALGTRVMVLAWDFAYSDHEGQHQETITSSHLQDAVAYPLRMHELVDDPELKDSALIKGMFVETGKDPEDKHQPHHGSAEVPESAKPEPGAPAAEPELSSKFYSGTIHNLGNGFGFITSEAFRKNIFFHYSNLKGVEFSELATGQELWFREGLGQRGPEAFEVQTQRPESLISPV